MNNEGRGAYVLGLLPSLSTPACFVNVECGEGIDLKYVPKPCVYGFQYDRYKCGVSHEISDNPDYNDTVRSSNHNVVHSSQHLLWLSSGTQLKSDNSTLEAASGAQKTVSCNGMLSGSWLLLGHEVQHFLPLLSARSYARACNSVVDWAQNATGTLGEPWAYCCNFDDEFALRGGRQQVREQFLTSVSKTVKAQSCCS
eukprot:4702738-Amphidinium_carterae.2